MIPGRSFAVVPGTEFGLHALGNVHVVRLFTPITLNTATVRLSGAVMPIVDTMVTSLCVRGVPDRENDQLAIISDVVIVYRVARSKS